MTNKRDRPTDQIKTDKAVVTPVMIEAGVIAFEQFSDSYGPDQLVEAIYIAMHARR